MPPKIDWNKADDSPDACGHEPHALSWEIRQAKSMSLTLGGYSNLKR